MISRCQVIVNSVLMHTPLLLFFFWDVLYSHFVQMLCPVNQLVHHIVLRDREDGLTQRGLQHCINHERFTICQILVSHIYTCCSNHQVPSHHASLLSALPSVHVPFFLTNRAGFIVDMLTQISSNIGNGLSFHCIEGIIRHQYEQSYWRVRYTVVYDDDFFKHKCSATNHEDFPEFGKNLFAFLHKKLIRSVFVSYSLLFDQVYYNDMTKRTSKSLACDHTFKSATNIGMTRESNRRWIKTMKCIFCVPGENRNVLHWRFTKGEPFEEVREMFQELNICHQNANAQLNEKSLITVANEKGLLSDIFPNLAVKLDLFHAVQRFVSTLPMTVRLQTDI